MKVRSLIFLFSLLTVLPSAYGQKEITDTLAANFSVKPVQSNELYFEAMKAKAHDDNETAIELFRKFVQIQPEAPSAYFELAKLYADGKDPNDGEYAEKAIRKAIELDGKNKWYREEHANILSKKARFEDAGNVAAELADREKTDASYAALAANYYERAQKYQQALTYIDKAVERSGHDEEMLLRKVQICLDMNDIDQAANVVKELIAQNPKSGKYYKMLGELYDNSKMPEKTLQVFQDAEKVIPGDPAIDVGLAEHYLKVGDSAKYRTYARRAILNKKLDVETQLEFFEIYVQGMSDSAIKAEGMPIVTELVSMHPKEPMLLAAYADFLEADGQPDKAIENYKRSLAIKSSNFNVWERLLGALTDKSQADSLIRYSEKAIKLFPNQSVAHYYNGVGHFNKKEYKVAINAFDRAAGLVPDTNPQELAIIYSMLGDVYNLTKEYNLSDQSFDKALEYEPNNATVLNNYAYYLSERNQRLEEALAMSEKSLELRPNETTFIDTHGWILYKKGEYEQARDEIEKAIAAGSRKADGTIYDHLGNIYSKLGNSSKALDNWKIAKEKGADDPLLDKKIAEGKLYE